MGNLGISWAQLTIWDQEYLGSDYCRWEDNLGHPKTSWEQLRIWDQEDLGSDYPR